MGLMEGGRPSGIKDQEFLSSDNVIVSGDLNLTLNSREYWGDVARPDPLVDYFSHFFENLKLIDVEPEKMVPTWRNSRRGRAGITKNWTVSLAENVVEEAKNSDLGLGILGLEALLTIFH